MNGLFIIQVEKSYQFDWVYIATLGILFFITIIILFISHRILIKDYKAKIVQQEKQLLINHIKDLEEFYKNFDYFNYSYLSIIDTIHSLISNRKMEELNKYFENHIIPAIQKIEDTETIINGLDKIKLLELKGILFLKTLSAMNQDIDLSLNIQNDIESVSMEMLDLCRVVEEFMNNAIEAAKETSEKRLAVHIKYYQNYVYIAIANTASAFAINLDIIYKKEVTSKKGHIGMGLYSARKILCKYDNIMHTTSYANNIFIQRLEICTPIVY